MIIRQGSKQIGGSDTNCWNQDQARIKNTMSIEDFYRYIWIVSSIQWKRDTLPEDIVSIDGSQTPQTID